jgi:hypothetical protein
MKRKLYLLALLMVAATVVAIALKRSGDFPAVEANEARQWFKGNTHTHSLWSDGNDFPEMIVSWYQEQGYDFLALSDHNVLSRGDRWMPVAEVEKRRKVEDTGTMEKYRQGFGDPWVETRGNPGQEEVRLKTLAEIRPRFEAAGDFLLIEAEEITDRFRNHQVHINAINLDEVILPQGGDSVVETMRNNLRKVKEQSERLERPILTHVNHPNFHWSISPQDLAEVVEEQFFEVYNGHPGINHLGDAERPGDEVIWDIANTLRLLAHKAPPLFGVATDDSHYYHGGNVSPGRGWVMVRAGKLEADALIAAMERGDFYASSGVVLEDVAYDQATRTHQLRIRPADGVTYETRFVGTRISSPEDPGAVLATVSGTDPSYQLTNDDLYVRAVVTSSRAHPNPSYKDQREQAWTQPVGWRE